MADVAVWSELVWVAKIPVSKESTGNSRDLAQILRTAALIARQISAIVGTNSLGAGAGNC